MNTHKSFATDKWMVAAEIVNHLQNILDESGMTTEKLVKKLAISWPSAGFPVENANISIIYRTYITPVNYKVLVENGEPKSDVLLDDSSLSSGIETIKSVIHKGESILSANKSDCNKMGFFDCGNLIIVPMRIDFKNPDRIIGVFIIQLKSENGFTKDDKKILDAIADRLAVFIHYVDNLTRSKIIQKFFDELISNIGSYHNESQIFETVIDHLSHHDLSERWFSRKEINIILLHPFFRNKFYLVCENGGLNKDFLEKNEVNIKSQKIQAILGQDAEKLLTRNELFIYNTPEEITSDNLPNSYRSYAIIPMLVRAGRNIGFFILRNNVYNYSYKDEYDLLGRLADFTASTLRNFRRDKIIKQLHNFRTNFIMNNTDYSDKILYNECIKSIESIYGQLGFASIALSQDSRSPKLVQSNIEHLIQDDVINIIEPIIRDNQTAPQLINKKSLFIVPIIAESKRIANFIIIHGNKEFGVNTSTFIQELTSLIGFKQSMRRKKDRLNALTEFGKEITRNIHITETDAFDLVYKYTSKVMSVANMYIALFNKKTNEITFPLFYKKDDKTGEINPLKIESRYFDYDKKGRTEVILETKKHILINTRQKSEEWYAKLGHSEQIGDPFASWAGVPIINNDDAIGVIAIYHPNVDYLYTENNIIFLDNIATHISDLLNRLRLEESIKNNSELKKAQAKIAASERQMVTSLLAQDMIHNLNGSVSPIAIKIQESIDGIEEYKINHRPQTLVDSIEDLSKAYTSTLKLLDNIKNITRIEKETINITKIIDENINQVKITKHLNNIVIKRLFSKNADKYDLDIHRRTFSNTIYSILSNAGDAITESIKNGISEENLFIAISIEKFEDNFIIDIADNGHPCPIPENQVDTLFEYGQSHKNGEHLGYGLWRAKTFLESEHGSITLVKNTPLEKKFRLMLPSINNNPTAIIIDDQEDWIEILSKWLSRKGYTIRSASDIKSARQLAEEIKIEKITPEIILLDISLDKEQSRNVDGLSLINDFTLIKPTIISLVTAFPEHAVLDIIPKSRTCPPISELFEKSTEMRYNL